MWCNTWRWRYKKAPTSDACLEGPIVVKTAELQEDADILTVLRFLAHLPDLSVLIHAVEKEWISSFAESVRERDAKGHQEILMQVKSAAFTLADRNACYRKKMEACARVGEEISAQVNKLDTNVGQSLAKNVDIWRKQGQVEPGISLFRSWAETDIWNLDFLVKRGVASIIHEFGGDEFRMVVR